MPRWVAVLLVVLALSPGSDRGLAAEESATVTGAVWIDQNLDGIRQPDEPLLPDVQVAIWAGARPLTPVQTDADGQYTTSLTPLGRYHFAVVYTDPDTPLPGPVQLGTHSGCADVSLRPGDTERRVPVRVRPLRQIDGRIEVPAEPLDWPLADGHFFKQTAGIAAECDSGYAVTNQGGIPFWETWQQLGVDAAGYPLSSRFDWEGYATQIFEHARFASCPDCADVAVTWGDMASELSQFPPEITIPEPSAN